MVNLPRSDRVTRGSHSSTRQRQEGGRNDRGAKIADKLPYPHDHSPTSSSSIGYFDNKTSRNFIVTRLCYCKYCRHP